MTSGRSKRNIVRHSHGCLIDLERLTDRFLQTGVYQAACHMQAHGAFFCDGVEQMVRAGRSRDNIIEVIA